MSWLVICATALAASGLTFFSGFGPRWLPLGGLLSGFFGGLSGMQGALRSAFLVRAGLSKEEFVGTGVVVACLIDASRIGVYYNAFPESGGLDGRNSMIATRNMRAKLKDHFPVMLSAGWAPSTVFVVHCVLYYGLGLYDERPWLDMPAHFLGGAAIAHFFAVGVEHLDRLGILRVGSRRTAMVVVIGLVGITTVAWELAEFSIDFFFQAGAQLGLTDTMKDQFLGLVGGAVYLGAGRAAVNEAWPEALPLR